MYSIKVLFVAAGGFQGDYTSSSFTVICTSGGVFSCGGGIDEDGDTIIMPELGHGEGVCSEAVPRPIEALRGKTVTGAVAGDEHTAVWTEAGELFTFGVGDDGMLGHGGNLNAHVPRLIEALAGKTVVGASVGVFETAVWTEAGEIFGLDDGAVR